MRWRTPLTRSPSDDEALRNYFNRNNLLSLEALKVTKKNNTSLADRNLLSFSAGPTANETIAFPLNHTGTYIIGVSAFSGSLNYRLRIITSQ